MAFTTNSKSSTAEEGGENLSIAAGDGKGKEFCNEAVVPHMVKCPLDI